MTINELPYDCFTTYCTVTGTPEEIDEAFEDYRNRYPYMQYATRIKERTESTAVFVRWTRKEDLMAACIHTPVENPVGDQSKEEPEKGKDHTIFQTNVT